MRGRGVKKIDEECANARSLSAREAQAVIDLRSPPLLNKQLSDLHGIGGGPFAQVVGDDPES